MSATATILTLHIGGAHFSTCLFMEQTGEMVPGTYQRIPISYKIETNMLLQLWTNAIADLPAVHLANLTGCAIAAPLPFVDDSMRPIPACAARYSQACSIDLAAFFANILNLHPECVRIHYNGDAYLKGELLSHPHLDVSGVAGVYLGTDLSASVTTVEGTMHRLNWEVQPCLDKYANDYFSAQVLLKAYYDETGISVLNVEQLTALSKDSPSAREILRRYLDDLADFLSCESANSHIHTIILGGDIIRANFPAIRLSSLNASVNLICGSKNNEGFHTGLSNLLLQDHQLLV